MTRQKMIFSPSPSPRRHVRRPAAALRFTPTAWAKLLFLRDAGETEVGGFGISAADNLLLIEDVQLVQQVCDLASVIFDDASVADYFDRQVDAGVPMSRCGRIWLHTHPGDSPAPSCIDEETFAHVFGHTEWALMFILAARRTDLCTVAFPRWPGRRYRAAGRRRLLSAVYRQRPRGLAKRIPGQCRFSADDSLCSLRAGRAPDPFDDDWLFGWDRPFDEVGFTDTKEHSRAI